MYEIKLYVMGQTTRSIKAFEDLKMILEAKHKGQYSLKIIDVMGNPQQAEMDMVFATPTAVRASPPPKKRVVGDLSKCENVLAGLGLGGNSYEQVCS